MSSQTKFSSRAPVLAIGLAIAAVGSVLQPTIVSQVYAGTDTLELVKALQSSALYFGTAMATATATLLGLMLTLLSLATSASADFDEKLFVRVKLISLLAVTGFIGSLILLAVLSLPLGKFPSIPSYWYQLIYYVINTLCFSIFGIVTALTLFLTDAIFTAIHRLHPDS